jgi:hypothetical protein
MIVEGDDGRHSAILVHHEPCAAIYDLDELTCGAFGGRCTLIKLDDVTESGVAVQGCDGKISIAGYGVAVATNAVAGCDVAVGRDWA